MSGEARCFAVRRGDVEERFNVLWGAYQRQGKSVIKRLKSEGVDVVPLSALLTEPLMNGVFKKPDNVGRGMRLINVFDLYADTTVDLSSVEHLEVTPAEAKRFAVAAGDIFFTRSSLKPDGVAWSAYLEEQKQEAVFECHLIRARVDQNLCVPGFVSNFAHTGLAREYLIARAGVTTMATVDQGAINEMPVVLPSPLVQSAMLATLNVARETRRAKLAEAEGLLAGLDGFLLETLGLVLPPADKRKVFGARVRDAHRQGHLNADFFHPERVLAVRGIESAGHLDHFRLESVVSFIRDQIKAPDQVYLSLAHVQSNTGELLQVNEIAAGTCSTFEENDVLFARLRPYLNKVYRAETAGSCSPEFHVMRVRDADVLHPDYLAAILRSSLILAQTRHMMTGNTHPRLTNEDVINLVIPMPKADVQETIAAEARRRREEARRLRAEAEEGWEAAKRAFEEQLLGPATKPA